MELDYQELDAYRHKTCSTRQMFFCGYCKKDIEENQWTEKYGKWTAWWKNLGPDSGNPLVDEEGWLMKLVCPECIEKWWPDWEDWEKQEGKEEEMNASNGGTASSSMEEEEEKDPSSMECD